MLNQYETTFILTPVLSDDDAKQTVNAYVDLMKSHGAEVIHQAHWGLKNLKYPIKKKTTGIYHHIEFAAPTKVIDLLEIAYRRDESVLRYLTVRLDKFAVKYNEDKKAGKVGAGKKKVANPKKADNE